MTRKLEVLKLSTSAIKCYEQCPRKYYFQYIERPKIEDKDWSHLTLGNFVHEVLEDFHNHLLRQPQDEWRPLMGKICTAKSRTHEYRAKLSDEIRDSAKSMLVAYLKYLEENGLTNVQSNEERFSVHLDDDLLIRGVIDRVDLGVDGNPDIYHIIDYKTGKSKYLDEFQLLVYGIPFLEKNPDMETYKASYLALKEDMKWLTYEFTKRDVEKVKEKIRSVARRIREDSTWEPRPQFLCNWCDYEDLCDASPASKARKQAQEVRGEINWE